MTEELNEKSLLTYMKKHPNQAISAQLLKTGFGGSSQAHARLLQSMAKKGLIAETGSGKTKQYKLKEASMSLSPRHASGIDAFFGGVDLQAPMREELGLPAFADNDGIRSFLATDNANDPPPDFGQMGLTASGMVNPFWEGTLPNTIKVGSIDQLFARGFITADHSPSHLIHKSERDLWRLSEADGGVVIERLFDAAGNPLKG